MEDKMEIQEEPPFERIDSALVTNLLGKYQRSAAFKWEYPRDLKPLLEPVENFACRIKTLNDIYLCEEYVCTEPIDNATFQAICQEIKRLSQHENILNYVFYSIESENIDKGSTIRFYTKFTKKTSLRAKITNQGRSYPPPSELYSLYLQLQSALTELYKSSLYKGINGKKVLFFLPFISPSCVYIFAKENYKIGISTGFIFGDNSLERFICPEILVKENTYLFPSECWDLTQGAKNILAYSIGALFMYYSTLREPNVVPPQMNYPVPAKHEDIAMDLETSGSAKKGQNSGYVTLEEFDKSGALKRQGNNQNPYNSVPTDTKLMEDLNTRVKNMISKRDARDFFEGSLDEFKESVFEQHLEIFEHTLYYHQSKTLKKSLEVDEIIYVFWNNKFVIGHDQRHFKE